MFYILTGLPYSGKTTLTKELVARLGCHRVSMDDGIEERNFEVEKMTQEDWNTVYSEGYEKLEKLLAEGKSVVLDLGNLKRSERETARQIAKSAGSEYKLIYVKVPLSTIKERWLKNAETKERGQLEEVSLNRALDMFEEPALDENYILYDPSMDVEEFINSLHG